MKKNPYTLQLKGWMTMVVTLLVTFQLMASSHREAPLIANDPLADNTDVYAFRSPDNPNTITIIATYVPGQLPHGGPNYYNFGTNGLGVFLMHQTTEPVGSYLVFESCKTLQYGTVGK